MPWPQISATQYHAQFGLPDKCRAIKGLVVCNDLDLKPLDLLICGPESESNLQIADSDSFVFIHMATW